MARRRPLPLVVWSSAYVGCVLFLVAGLIPSAWPSWGLVAELFWLALIGSIPTTLLLGAAARAARARSAVIAATTLALAVLTLAVGWEHADFLLSGPRFALDERRLALRAAIGALLAVIGAGGWLWLVGGMRIGRRRALALWLIVTALVVALLSDAISRYRAYDHSIAQLVLPAALLTGAMVYLLLRRSRDPLLLIGVAVGCSLLGVASRFVRPLTAMGERELIAHSRAGALVSLYLLPTWEGGEPWLPSQQRCPNERAALEQAPIGIPPEARRNVILITVDALRDDVVAAEVDGRAIMPNLSRLARQGISFRNATTTYPATLFALGSAFTGSSPAELYLSPALPETIFAWSKPHLDRQIAVWPDVSWFRLPIVRTFLAPEARIDFAPNDAAATEAMIGHLRSARSQHASVMAWIHYYSPHDPYLGRTGFSFGPGKKRAYLSEVAYFDAALGRLLGYLKQDGWLEDSLVVFFSDHGEALGESGYFGHHVYLNGWMIDIPLVLWHEELVPAQPRVGVSLVDVAPTVLHFLGLPIPSDIEGQSLFTLGSNRADRPSFSEAFPVRGMELFESFRLPALDDETIVERLRSIRVANKGYEPKGAVTRGDYRLVHHRAADAWLLYQITAPGTEALIRGDSESEVREVLRTELEEWERRQLHRIECRLRVNVDGPSTPYR